jgi:hypothetical protein
MNTTFVTSAAECAIFHSLLIFFSMYVPSLIILFTTVVHAVPEPNGAAAAASMGLSMIGNAVEAKKCALLCCPKTGTGNDRGCEKQSTQAACTGKYSNYPGQGDHACFWDPLERKCFAGAKCRDKTFSGWQVFGASCGPCVDVTPLNNYRDYDVLTKCPAGNGLGCDNCCHKQAKNRCNGFYADYKNEYTEGKGSKADMWKPSAPKGKSPPRGKNAPIVRAKTVPPPHGPPRAVNGRGGARRHALLRRNAIGSLAGKTVGAAAKQGAQAANQGGHGAPGQPQQNFIAGPNGSNIGILEMPAGAYIHQNEAPQGGQAAPGDMALPTKVYYPLPAGEQPYIVYKPPRPQGAGMEPPKLRTDVNVDQGSGDYICAWTDSGCFPQRKCGDW